MPLAQGKSKKSFDKNLETEMKAGKPQKHSLAIAYAVQRKNKKKAKGGPIEAEDPTAPLATPDAAVAAAPPAKEKATGAGSGSGNSPTKTNTETGGSSPGGASTGGVGSGIGGAGTGGAATGGASTGGAGTVTVTISGSSSTETSSGAGAKKGGKGASKPAGPITLNISNVGGKTDAGSVASGDGPGAGGTGGKGDGSGGGGGGAAPDEPDNFSTSGKDPKEKKSNLYAEGGLVRAGSDNLGKDQMKRNLAIGYAVQKKNKAHGGLVSAANETRPTADNQFAEGGPVRAGSYRPTADSGETHACTHMCQDMTVREHEMVRAGSQRPTADSHEHSDTPLPTGLNSNSTTRGGSSRPTADSFETQNAPKRPKEQGGILTRGGSSRPTADSGERTNSKFAFGGDVEDEDTNKHMGTLAEAIAKRLSKHLMAGGGEIHDDGLEENSEEKGNFEDQLSYDALGKEQYDDDQLSDQPDDSNETGDDEEKESENKRDSSILSKIKSRNKKKK